jgi:small subunit ribosomal protein S6
MGFVINFWGCSAGISALFRSHPPPLGGLVGAIPRKGGLMRNYELAYIADPELDEKLTEELEGKVKGWIESAGGTIEKIDHWGKRRMAYEINNKKDGFYTFIYAQLPPQANVEIERTMKLNEQILRYMITVQETS